MLCEEKRLLIGPISVNTCLLIFTCCCTGITCCFYSACDLLYAYIISYKNETSSFQICAEDFSKKGRYFHCSSYKYSPLLLFNMLLQSNIVIPVQYISMTPKFLKNATCNLNEQYSLVLVISENSEIQLWPQKSTDRNRLPLGIPEV